MRKIKKILSIVLTMIIMAAVLPVTSSAEDLSNYNTAEITKLQAFLNSQSAIPGKTNGQVINPEFDLEDPWTWLGVTWTDTSILNVYMIEWTSKNLAGSLDVGGFKYLRGLYCSNNRLLSLNVSGCDNLSELACSSNLLSSLSLNNLWELRNVDCTSNHLASVSYSMYGGINLTAIGNGYVSLRTAASEAYRSAQSGVNIFAEEYDTNSPFVKWMMGDQILTTEKTYNIYGYDDRPLQLDAYFSGIPYYTVTFNLQGGSTDGGGNLEQLIAQGGAAIAPIPLRAGYDFAGWDKTFNNISGDMVVNALWSPRPTTSPTPTSVPLPTTPPLPTVAPPVITPYPITFYTVNFILNGGTQTDTMPLEQYIQEGGYAYAPAVVKPGYRLVGWDADFTNLKKNVTAKAIWEEIIITHDVVFDINYGIRIGGGEIWQTILDGNGAEAPEVIRHGYTFDGWDLPFDKIVEDITITASWKKEEPKEEPVDEPEVETYTLTYDANGGEGFVWDTTEYEASDIAALADGSDLTKEGYEFTGWSYTVDGAAIEEEEIMVEEDVTLYAVWEAVDEPEPVQEDTDTTEPPKKPVENLPKTGIQSGVYFGIVMLIFGSGVLINDIYNRKRTVKQR